MKELSIERFREILPTICDQDTSSDPTGWTSENPLWGHCAVVSLVAQSLFGGELYRASLEEIPKLARMRSHYWNVFTLEGAQDFTRSQFGMDYPADLKGEIRTRAYVLSHPDTMKRYKILAYRLVKAVANGNSLFEDPIYQTCFSSALDSHCQKMKFGCVIIHRGEVVYKGCNKIIEPLKSLCDPTCIRFSVTSRTESMLGACGHAEEGLWEVVRAGIPIQECDLYVAGLYASGLPWLKQTAEHTCLRCAVQMYNARLKTIYVPVVNQWVSITTEEALETACLYATKEKSV